MRKFPFFSAIPLLLLLLVSCGETKELPEDPQVSEEESPGEVPSENVISEEDLAQTVKYLSSDELAGRKTGTAGAEKAAEFIEEVFKNNNIEPFFDTYRSSFVVEGVTGYNVVGYLEGADPGLKDEVIIIGAHYDHIGNGNPVGNDELANGANDNASGTAAVLELAKYFSGVETKRSILFALFSAEEMGLIGSGELASKLKDEGLQPYVMFNIEMIGVPMEDRDYLAYLTGYENSNLAEKFNEYSDYEVLGFLPEAKEYDLYRRSDNYPFYQAFGIPSHTVSTFDFTNYSYYHHVDDEFEQLDLAHMDELVEALVPGLRKMANSEEKEIKMNP